MSQFYNVGMPDSQWQQMSQSDRLKYLANSGGPTGNFINSMMRSRDAHPNWNSPNYFDSVFGALAKGSGKIAQAHVPGAKSGIGMMSGDAAGDIANATADTTSNYGPDPRNDYVPPAAQNAASAAAQQGRVADWMGRLGERLGGATGTTDAYLPGAGQEWAAIEGYDPVTGQVRWSPRRKK